LSRDFASQKLLTSANVSRSYSKIKVAVFFKTLCSWVFKVMGSKWRSHH